MKKVVLGMLVLGLTSLGFSQDSAEVLPTFESKNVSVSTANANYLQSVSDRNISPVIKELQGKAATYDVTKNAKFDILTKESFKVVFQATNGGIIANYNRHGEIISARENFKNVILPMEVRKKAFEGNDGWVMTSNKYVSLYHNNDITNRVYKIKLTNQNLKKDLIIDMLNIE